MNTIRAVTHGGATVTTDSAELVASSPTRRRDSVWVGNTSATQSVFLALGDGDAEANAGVYLPPLATDRLTGWNGRIAAVATGSAADAFLGTQGDPFDTQNDMAMALVGAVAALLLFSKLHDRQLPGTAPEQQIG